MALPQSRDITLAPGTQIPSSLLNNLQDFLVDGRFHQSTTKQIHVSKGTGAGVTYAGGRVAMTAGDTLDIGLDVVATENISSYAVTLNVDTGGDQNDMQLIRRTGGGSESVLDTTAAPTTVGDHEVFNLFFGAVIVGGSDSFVIRISADGGNAGTTRVYRVSWSSAF